LQGFQSSRLFGNMPVGLMLLKFVSLLNTTAPDVSKDKCLLAMQELVSLIEVAFVRRSRRETVSDAGAGINFDVAFMPKCH
jgi:hypothetical protein